MIRPSSLPMLKQCSQFSGEGGKFAELGILRHEAFNKLLTLEIAKNSGVPATTTEDEILAPIDENERENILWAVEQVKLKAPMSDYPLILETKRSFTAPDFSTIEGTPDATCGPVLFDLKWRRRDYTSQMAAYALMLFEEGWTCPIDVYVLYAESKFAKHFTLTREEAEQIVSDVLNQAKGEPTPCDYCHWCSKLKDCKPYIDMVNTVASNRTDWQLEQYHASEIKTPEEMGKALRLARRLSKWCEGIEYHANEMATKQGSVPDGFKLKSRRGNRFITSVSEAFPLVGLPQDDFLKLCDISLKSLTEAYSAFHGMQKKPAERDLERKLGEVIQRKPSSMSLVEEKE